MRRGPTAIMLAGLAVLCGACMGPAASEGAAPAAAQPAALAKPVPPGEDPRVQQWFKNREAAQIELNNALEAARDLTATSGDARAICARLANVSTRLQASERAPDSKVDEFANAGIAEFVNAGRACLAGDFDTMRRHIGEGTAQRAAAQHHLDEVLMGEE